MNIIKFIRPTLLIIISCIIVCLLIIYRYKDRFELYLNYKRCPKKKINGLMKDIFDKNEIKNDNANWDIYIPCGYNNVETELKIIDTYNDKQKIFGINGVDKICSKNNLWNILEIEYGRTRSKHIMPETFILNNKDHMKLFSKHYNKNNLYILKKNLQRKKGIKLCNDYYYIMNSHYDNFKIVQEFKNSLLINERKFNVRLYMLIICKNNSKTVYFHKYNKLLYAKNKYLASNLSDLESNVTNSYTIGDSIYKTNPYNLEELKTHITDDNMVSLLNKIHNTIYMLSRVIILRLGDLENIKQNTKFQLFGVDIIIDDNYNPYILEINKGPDMNPKNDRDKKMKLKVLNDMFSKIELINEDNYNLYDKIYSI